MLKLPTKQVVNTIARSLFLVALVMFATEKEARAYTDPGTGAFVYQAVYAAFLGGAFYFRKFLSRIFRKRQ